MATSSPSQGVWFPQWAEVLARAPLKDLEHRKGVIKGSVPVGSGCAVGVHGATLFPPASSVQPKAKGPLFPKRQRAGALPPSLRFGETGQDASRLREPSSTRQRHVVPPSSDFGETSRRPSADRKSDEILKKLYFFKLESSWSR